MDLKIAYGPPLVTEGHRSPQLLPQASGFQNFNQKLTEGRVGWGQLKTSSFSLTLILGNPDPRAPRNILENAALLCNRKTSPQT